MLKSLYEYFVGRQEPELTLMNLDGQAGIEFGSPQTTGVNLVSLRAVLTNRKSTPVYVAVSRVDANLGASKCLREPIQWPVLRVNEGISVEAGLCNISRVMLSGEVAQGRIDVLLKYGAAPTKLDKELPIKGQLVVTAGNRRVSWMPDGDSASPAGMIPHSIIVPEGQTAVNAVATAP